MAKRHRFRGAPDRRDRADYTVPFGARFLELLGSPSSVELASRIRSGEFTSAVEYPFDYGRDLSPADFAVDYQTHSLFKKYPFEGYFSKERRVSEAIAKFKASESSCANVSLSLRDAWRLPVHNQVTGASIIHMARRKILALLGEFDFRSCLPYMGFGPGASTGHKRSCGDPYYKFRDLPEVTPDCEAFLLSAIFESPLWCSHLTEVAGGPLGFGVFPLVPGNRITTVPKDAKSERVIAIEPEGNMFIQKGLGGFIRRSLRKVGIDLNDQTANQQAARQGSVDGSLATIDLSSASDSIAMSLVRELLPNSWVTAIERCRSPRGTLPGGTNVLYRKVSSMGNGFTFELESLIFWALSSSVVDSIPETVGSRVLVYGDDIVVHSAAASRVIEMLRLCGFATNLHKTFISGAFRESCGKHFYKGHDVTPVYIRKAVDSHERICWMHNSILQWYHRTRAIFWLSRDEYEFVQSLRLAVNPARRTFIPFAERDSVDFLGDIGLIANFSEALPKRHSLTGSYVAVGYVERRFTREFDDSAFLVRQLFSMYKRDPAAQDGEAVSRRSEADDSPPSRVNTLSSGVSRVKVVVHQWSDAYMVL